MPITSEPAADRPAAASSRWSLVQYTVPDDARPHLGVQAQDQTFAAPEHWPPTLMDLLRQWSDLEGDLHDLDPRDLIVVTGASVVAPLTYPAKVICAGANYYDHAEEMGTQRPDPAQVPFFFLKPPTTTVIGPGQHIRISTMADAQVDWEAELAVVIADQCRDLSPAQAPVHIAGYLAANDISARGRFGRPSAVFPPFQWDWLGHKGGDGFCPLGPGLVPRWHIADPQDLTIRLSVNGIVKQDSSTRLMVVGVDELVAAASQMVTLEPGDVILTGTPAGVGMPRKTFLSSGDVMTIDIDQIGRLENTVVESTPPPR